MFSYSSGLACDDGSALKARAAHWMPPTGHQRAYRAHAWLDRGYLPGYDADALRDGRTASVSFSFWYTYDRGHVLKIVSVFSRKLTKGLDSKLQIA